jgi:hypothetical protein
VAGDCFKNESSQPARMLISVAPAGLEMMFFEAGQPVEAGHPPAPPSPEEIAKLLEIAPRYGIKSSCRRRALAGA